MLPVSSEYHQSLTKDDRQTRTKIEITWTDPYIDQSIQVTTNSEARFSWVNQTADSITEPAFKYAALDGTWTLDGTYHLAPDTEELARRYQMGYWSGKVSLADSTFSLPYPRITVRFQPRPVFGLKVIGDSKRQEWPVDFTVKIYDKTNVLVHTETVTDNFDIYWQKSISEATLYDVTRMELEIQKWSHPGRHAKILEFFTSVSEIYEGDDIVLLSLLEERETSQGSLPIGNITANEIDIRLINANDRFNPGNIHSPYHQLMKPNRKVKAWIGPVLPSGIVEYQPLGVFWTRDWSIPEKTLYADTTARDRMEMLKEITYYCEVYQNANLYDRAVHVLEDAKINFPDLEYWVDEELKEHVIPWFYMDTCSHRAALRNIAERCTGQVYADRKGVVRIEGPNFIKMPE